VLTDALLVAQGERGHDLGTRSPHVLVRSLAVVEGQFTAASSFCPRGDFGRSSPVWDDSGPALRAKVAGVELTLCGSPPDTFDAGGAHWLRDLTAGQCLTFTLLFGAEEQTAQMWSDAHALACVRDTGQAWQSWSDLHAGFGGPWSEQVRLSGRVLQGLTFAPTGAVISAPTTSLPREGAGGPTHDGRYASMRGIDAITCAQLAAMCAHEAVRTIGWIVDSAAEVVSEDGLQEVFGVGGETDLSEQERQELAGWGESGPVRLGDDRWRRRDVATAGELLSAVARVHQLPPPVAGFQRTILAAAADSRVAIPARRDAARDAVMRWVAVDRAAVLTSWPETPSGPAASTRIQQAELMGRALLRRALDPATGAYTGFSGSTFVEASALLVLLSGLVPASDEAMSRTVEMVSGVLSAPCGLLYRDEQAAAHREGTSLLCTYWLVECLARQGDLDRAAAIFDQATAYANDVGLLSEQTEPHSGQLLGNFPSAASHAGLICAAAALHRG
jgi:GH15 family glucan-1,4-alpha-glucosidase